jgi:hypothetical protein
MATGDAPAALPSVDVTRGDIRSIWGAIGGIRGEVSNLRERMAAAEVKLLILIPLATLALDYVRKAIGF